MAATSRAPRAAPVPHQPARRRAQRRARGRACCSARARGAPCQAALARDAFVLSCVLRPFPASGASVDDVEERLMHRYACARRAALFPGTPLLYAHEWLAGTPASPYRGGTRAPPASS